MTKPSKKRLTILLGLGALVIGLSVFYIQFFLARPIGSGPAGPNVSKQPFETAWTERKVHLVGIGDSVTEGLGAKSKAHSYFNRLLKNPSDEFPEMQGICLSAVLPNLEFENLAVSGSTSEQHELMIETRLKPRSPDVFGLVVMTTGGNDLIHSYGRRPPVECAMYGATLTQAEPWIEEFAKRLERMLTKIEANFPGGCEIYLGDIYDPTDGVGDAPSVYLPKWPDGLAIHAKYNQVIYQCAKQRNNIHVVPLHKTFLGHGSHCRQFWRSTYKSDDPNYWFYQNIEDPNDRGYDALRRIFLNSMIENSQLRKTAQPPEASSKTSSATNIGR